jgi:hypothetical protein
MIRHASAARRCLLPVMFAIGLSTHALPAKSQDVIAGSTAFLPQQMVGVVDRPRPEYDALGIRAGIFEISPSLSLEETYDENIYATDRNTVADYLTTTTGTLSAHSVGSGLSVSADGAITSNQYLHNSIENYVDFNGSGGLAYTVGRYAGVSAQGQFVRTHLSREDPSFPQEAITPPAVDTSGGSVAISSAFIHSNINLRVQLLNLDYHAVEFPDGILLSEAARNHQELTFDLRDNFLVARTISTFVHLIHKEYNYGHDAQSGTLNPDSITDTVGGGVAFHLTNLMQGEIGLGILHLRNHNVIEGNITTVSVLSNIQYFVTPLITATAGVERDTGPANIAGSSSYITTNAHAELDYEFRRNIIVSVNGSREYRVYTGIDATDIAWHGIGKVLWLLNRSLKLDFAYTAFSRRTPLQTYLGDNFNDRTFDLQVELAL